MNTSVKGKKGGLDARSRMAKLKELNRSGSIIEAAQIGKCLTLCESLGVREFNFKSIARVIDLRPALKSQECLIAHVTAPKMFLIVEKEVSYGSPLVEVDGEVLWASDPAAEQLYANPEFLGSNSVAYLPTREGK